VPRNDGFAIDAWYELTINLPDGNTYRAAFLTLDPVAVLVHDLDRDPGRRGRQ